MTRIVLAIALVGLLVGIYVQWVTEHYPPAHVCRECPEPQPRIEDHVAEVMRKGNETGSVTFTVEEEILALASIPPPDADGYVYAKGKDGVWQYIAPPDCPTWQALQRAGVEITCTNAFGEIPKVNYWPSEMPMGCSRIKKVVLTDKRIEVERK